VKPAVHRHISAIRQGLCPATDPAAEVRTLLDNVDGDAAFCQPGRGCQPSDASADDHDMWPAG
jgi:hypothetical protein